MDGYVMDRYGIEKQLHEKRLHGHDSPLLVFPSLQGPLAIPCPETAQETVTPLAYQAARPRHGRSRAASDLLWAGEGRMCCDG